VTPAFIAADWPAPQWVTAYTTTREEQAQNLPASPTGTRIQQEHGTVVVNAATAADGVIADACYSRQALVSCQVVTADCLPLLLCNRAGTEVAAVHAGWRGLVAGVIEAALDRLQSAPQELLVWLGPAISQAHYEVGGELREAFLAQAPALTRDRIEACFTRAGDRFMADLVGLARLRLECAGVDQVYGGQACTYAEPELFYSYRRDGPDSGRMRSLIYFSPA
jgi:YfiH family protein